MSRLKSLELQGYKTFANRTIFEFPEAVTSIVGPNGSGKSNVSDAIRWVLGEQSFSMLRARKTEDMIFAGSEQKTRAGMATATIIFDNQDGWLPIDFSEVSITRRAYRDGQNEYYLNGQKIRLKDIAELLAKSGMAERTYTIVGQGSVDAALSLRPEERRRFFEEAAGIGLYRSRREEAIQRLENTRRNLERIMDIVGELEPRIASLEKQAKKAQEYERIKADLQLLLREWYGYHWHKNQKDLGHLRNVVEAQEKRFQTAKEQLYEIEEKVNQERTKLNELRVNLNEWHGQSSNLHRDREGISKKLAVLDERFISLTEQQKMIQNDQTKMEEEQTSRKEKLNQLIAELERLKTDLLEAVEQGKVAQTNLSERQKERDKVEEEIRQTRKVLVSNETKKVESEAKRNEWLSRVDNLNSSKESLDLTILNEEKELKKNNDLFEETQKNYIESEEIYQKYEDDYNHKKNDLRNIENDLKNVIGELNNIEKERTKVKTQYEILLQAEQSFSGINQGAKYILESAKQGKLAGKYRSFSSEIEVPKELETAIASVMGEYVDGIVIKENEDLINVLNFLENGDKGKAILIPEKNKFSEELFKIVNDPDVVGIASDLVKTPGLLKPAVQIILGNVLVVKTREAAQRIIKDLSVNARVVSLNGEIYYGNGIVIAGKETRGGIISRPRQKREMFDLLEQIEIQYDEKNDEVSNKRAQLDNCQKETNAIEMALSEAKNKMQQNNQALQKASLAVEQIKQKIEYQKKQLMDIESRKVQAEKDIQLVEKEIQNLVSKIEEYQVNIKKLNKVFYGMPLDELQAQVVHWNTQQAVIGRALKDTDNRVKENENTIIQNDSLRLDLQNRKKKLEDLFIELEKEKKEYIKQESEINGSIQLVAQKIEPAESELTNLEKEIDKVMGDQITAQHAVTVAERYVSQAHIDVTRQKEALDSLRHKIEDDFGLVSFQYTNEVSSPIPLPLEGFVSDLPSVVEITPEIEESVTRQRSLLRRMGAVNMEAKAEYESVKERYEFLTNQINDLKKADLDLQQVITELDELMKKEFEKTFSLVASEFKQIFTRLFGGGSARLVLLDKDNPQDSGVEIEARLPGRREQGLALLSGGERSLTAVALIFALLKISPTPFCVLDEVDAALDEANVGRFCDLLKELSQNTQFIIITHNRNTVQASGVIYGVTMGRDSVSQVISLKLDEVSEEMVK